ncbi:MAG: hypothetical protein ABI042_16345 [Verrucomicrobiota bacterium]
MEGVEKIYKPVSKPNRKPAKNIAPDKLVSELEKHILVDGLKIVIDLEKSRGSRLVDA